VATQEELIAAIQLRMVPGVGDIIARSLIQYAGSAQAVWEYSKERLMAVPGVGLSVAQEIRANRELKKRAEQELKKCKEEGIAIYYYKDEAYPQRLKSFPDSPLLLFGKGTIDCNPVRMLAVVGTRKCSEFGKEFTRQLVERLKDMDCTLVSGLALGIDTAAHRAAVEFGLPTLGVLGHGFNTLYPYQNRALAEEMQKKGGLLTEFLFASPPDAENFPKRNRIVAGICDALVVVETALKGGARITAEIANAYNKDVMAVPGRPGDLQSLGCNYLIRENKAILINTPEDLLKDLNWLPGSKVKPFQQQLNFTLSEEDGRIVQFIRERRQVGIDEIAFGLGMDQSYLAFRLLELEFSGFIRALPGKLFEVKR